MTMSAEQRLYREHIVVFHVLLSMALAVSVDI